MIEEKIWRFSQGRMFTVQADVTECEEAKTRLVAVHESAEG
jgi:hypothetical protein